MTTTAATDSSPRRALLRRSALPLVCAAIALTVLGPLLGRGFVLNYDMVFAPRQALVPDALGLGSALPRSVPADAVVSFATAVLPGDLVQKLVLLLALFLGPLGAGRLVPTTSVAVRVVAATTYGWSAYVAERLFMGHWPYLVSYACLPWIAAAAFAVRRGEAKSLPKLVLACAPAVLAPGGGIIAAVAALAYAGRRKALVTGAVAVVLNAPWWVPSVLHGGAALSPAAGVGAFAARAESWGSAVTSVLGLGGIWNAEVTPDSRASPITPVLILLGVVLAVLGLRVLALRWGAAPARALTLLGAFGVLLASAGSVPGGGDVLGRLVSHVPGAGLLRDAQKWAAWWALPLALGIALAVEAGARHLRGRAGRGALLAAAALLPVVAMPDLALAGFGRLDTVDYPRDWAEVRAVVAGSDQPGDVLALPLSAFRRFGWNAGRTQLDPAPRVLDRPTLIDDTVYVGGTPIAGEDSRMVGVRAALARGGDLGALGIGWVLVEHGTPGLVDQRTLAPLSEVWRGPWLTLYRVPGAVDVDRGGPPVAPVLVGDFAALTIVTLSLLWLALPAGRLSGHTWRDRRVRPQDEVVEE